MTAKQSQEDTKRSFAAAMSGEPVETPFSISFPDVESLAKVMLAPGRLNIVNEMTNAGSMSIRELARRLGRDFRAVHRDVDMLLKAGVIDHDTDGKIVFPFSAVHFDFTLEHEAA
ncbi:hypothetical protein NT01EI_2304 [Edwardsiella ictaluri 93-146]|uniref:Uncharacterized protein n=2 Tax=Edwardsiella ictaluri TaxID=67780 RepID=C5B8A3_EDWI9|nr:hypothetical protein NT01EI_2304 [Edwardsiella ictaluri 93-146]